MTANSFDIGLLMHLPHTHTHTHTLLYAKQKSLAVASIARDVGSSSDIMHFLPRLLKKTLQHERL